MKVQKFEVLVEQYGKMVLVKDGFDTYKAAAQWAAWEYGLGNWLVRPY